MRVMGWLRWAAFGVLAIAALMSLGLDAADVPEASHAVDVVVEQLVMPQVERSWETAVREGRGPERPARA